MTPAGSTFPSPMNYLVADSGSTKTHWALVTQLPGQPRVIRTAQTLGLNPLYTTPDQITSALREVLAAVGCPRPDELRFYGSGCSGPRLAVVEQALRTALTPMTRVSVESDLVGAALALSTPMSSSQPFAATTAPSLAGGQGGDPFIACIQGTGSIAALYDPATRQLQPMPALGYILGDEGSGAWYGRQLLSDYLKGQLPTRAREAFEDDFGRLTPESAIRHVYQEPAPNRYLATFAAFLGRHLDLSYAQQLAFNGIEAFWRRNILPIAQLPEGEDVFDVRLVGSVAYHLRPIIEQVAESHGYYVSRILKDPIEGLV